MLWISGNIEDNGERDVLVLEDRHLVGRGRRSSGSDQPLILGAQREVSGGYQHDGVARLRTVTDISSVLQP